MKGFDLPFSPIRVLRTAMRNTRQNGTKMRSTRIDEENLQLSPETEAAGSAAHAATVFSPKKFVPNRQNPQLQPRGTSGHTLPTVADMPEKTRSLLRETRHVNANVKFSFTDANVKTTPSQTQPWRRASLVETSETAHASEVTHMLRKPHTTKKSEKKNPSMGETDVAMSAS
jgi:hypothetical protein